MCSREDYPPFEDSTDWLKVRHARHDRPIYAMDLERTYGIPPRMGVIRREADRLRHSQARRGWQYDPSER